MLGHVFVDTLYICLHKETASRELLLIRKYVITVCNILHAFDLSIGYQESLLKLIPE